MNAGSAGNARALLLFGERRGGGPVAGDESIVLWSTCTASDPFWGQSLKMHIAQTHIGAWDLIPAPTNDLRLAALTLQRHTRKNQSLFRHRSAHIIPFWAKQLPGMISAPQAHAAVEHKGMSHIRTVERISTTSLRPSCSKTGAGHVRRTQQQRKEQPRGRNLRRPMPPRPHCQPPAFSPRAPRRSICWLRSKPRVPGSPKSSGETLDPFLKFIRPLKMAPGLGNSPLPTYLLPAHVPFE